MSHNKFKAGETQGTYVLTEPATAEEILAMGQGVDLAKPHLQLPTNPAARL